MDRRGHLLHTPMRGTIDGPDDATETYRNRTLLRALGGPARAGPVLQGLEGHFAQPGDLWTQLAELARKEAYNREFIAQSDWFHTDEGMREFLP